MPSTGGGLPSASGITVSCRIYPIEGRGWEAFERLQRARIWAMDARPAQDVETEPLRTSQQQGAWKLLFSADLPDPTLPALLLCSGLSRTVLIASMTCTPDSRSSELMYITTPSASLGNSKWWRCSQATTR